MILHVACVASHITVLSSHPLGQGEDLFQQLERKVE